MIKQCLKKLLKFKHDQVLRIVTTKFQGISDFTDAIWKAS